MRGQNTILVADIGGTNMRVALGDAARGLYALRILKNAEVADPRQPLAETAAAAKGRISSAVIALAGPVEGEEVALTNHPWRISRPALEESLDLQVLLVNDFLATAHAVPALDGEGLIPVRDGDAAADGNILVCGPGTGFGAAALIRSGGFPFGLPSEAGHMILGAMSGEERELLARISTPSVPLVVEDVISGKGLAALHRALSGRKLASEAIIASVHAGDGDSRSTVLAFLRFFGRVVGDLALAYDARGGVYIAGGLGLALAPFYSGSAFLDSFDQHPPYAERMKRIPIRIISHEQPALLGALQIGLAHIGAQRR